MYWKQWSLKQWNEALVRAVFLEQGRAETTVSRIDASGRFLSKCTKEESNPEEALQLFINAFGKTASSVREKFRVRAVVDPDEIPAWFAALYLTLLAASADNETAGMGDFRDRFAKIVKVTTGQSVDFSYLPSMWSGIKNWTSARSNLFGDCALLVLPDPKSEKLIGYSKRIAFPAYKDEIFLRKTLQKNQLSETSSFDAVARAVARDIGRANTLQNFLEEFREFQKLAARSENRKAFESPFWGAVRDICIEDAQEIARKKGISCLEIDITDASDPQLYCYLDQVAASRFEMPFKELNSSRKDGCKYIVLDKGQLPSANELQIWTSKKKNFRDSQIGKKLAAGWLIFLPNQLSELTSDGSFYEGGPVCLVTKSSELEPLISLCKNLGVKYLTLGTQGFLNGWSGLYINSVSEHFLKRLIDSLPPSVGLMLRTGWAPPRPRLSGGARYGQMLLLNPASNPTVRMRGAVKGVYRLLGSNSEEIKRGELIECDDSFQIPAVDLVCIAPNARSCEFTLVTEDEKSLTTKILLTAEPPEGLPVGLRDRTQWLVDGPTGMLRRLEGASSDSKIAFQVNLQLSKMKFPPLLGVDSKIPDCVRFSSDINDICPALSWMTQALTLRFEQRSTLNFDLLNEHVWGAAEADGHKWRALRQILFYGQWLIKQTQRNAPFSSISRAEIEMSLVSRNGELFTRIVGMLSRQSAARLAKLLLPGESCNRIGSTSALTIGCIEINVSSEVRAFELAQGMGAKLIKAYTGELPLAALIPSRSEMHLLTTAKLSLEAEKWDWGWSSVGNLQAPWPVGEVRRMRSGPRAWYWIKLEENKFVKTDSTPWAWMISSIAAGEVIARHSADGSIYWSKSLVEIPSSLSKWWMLFGGGCIAINADGQVIFTGCGCSEAIACMGWKSKDVSETIENIATNRRKLALRLKKSRQIFDV